MQRHDPKISWELYHRIYRMAVKNVHTHRIAATLHLPIRTVQNVIDRLSISEKLKIKNKTRSNVVEDDPEIKFLDIFILQKTRHTVADLCGYLIEENITHLSGELKKLNEVGAKAIAFQMSDIKEIDDAATEIILKFYSDYLTRGRFSAILDPSNIVEEYISQTDLDQKIPVFGTEKAFEEKAFMLSRKEKRK